jgi:hypothetical protein
VALNRKVIDIAQRNINSSFDLTAPVPLIFDKSSSLFEYLNLEWFRHDSSSTSNSIPDALPQGGEFSDEQLDKECLVASIPGRRPRPSSRAGH